MEQNQDIDILVVKPNQPTLLDLSEAYQNSITHHMDVEDKENLVFICRVLIQDENDFGLILPACLKEENKQIEFILPEQLCIFNPNKSYILKAEIVFEDQLMMPFLNECRIDLEGSTEATDDLDEQEDQEQTNDLEQPLKTGDTTQAEDELDDVLDAIAPMPVIEQKKTKLEEIAKALDQEFVKQALFKQKQESQKQEAPAPIRAPEPPAIQLTPEKLALKQRMKSMLKDMLG